jgi:hypothetical protein
MMRRYRVLLLISAWAGFAILVGVYFLNPPTPSESGHASPLRGPDLAGTENQPVQAQQTTEAEVAVNGGVKVQRVAV